MSKIEQKNCANCGRTYASSEDFYSKTSRWRLCDKQNLWFNCFCGSTLMLPAGKYSWYSPGLSLQGNTLSVFNRLSKFGTLPHIPASVMEIHQMLQNSQVEVAELAKKMRSDPIIAANVLSVANTIKSNRDPRDRLKISTLEHAITFAGRRTLSELVLTTALKSFETDCKVFDSKQFWKDSFLVGEIAERLCQTLSYSGSRDELFIGAALCNVGKFVQAFYLPESLDRIEQLVYEPKTLCTWVEAEKATSSPDHCVLGEIGATLWGLPQYVLEAATGHHTVKAIRSNRGLSQLEFIALANQMAHWVLLRPSRIDQALLEKLRLLANLSTIDLDKIGQSLQDLVKTSD